MAHGRIAAAVVLAAALAVAPATADPPHGTGARTSITCLSQCHSIHNATGASLTTAAGNANLCQSCHSPAGMASGKPISNLDRAVPGVGGTTHAFDVAATNPAYGAQPPEHPEMAKRVMNGNIVCSTCHNQHRANSTGDSSGAEIGAPVRVTALGSTGTLSSSGVYTGAGGLWYLVAVFQTGTEGTARFGFSKDNGKTWFPAGCSAATPAGCRTASVTPQVLDNGVEIAFAGAAGDAFLLNERWELAASYPFLRARLDVGDNAAAERFCRDCHREWVMDHTAIGTYDGTPRSHPIGVGLKANAKGSDRSAPLDGNGAVQGSGTADANRSNDLQLDSGGRVQCLTCHDAHGADGNTLTEALP